MMRSPKSIDKWGESIQSHTSYPQPLTAVHSRFQSILIDHKIILLRYLYQPLNLASDIFQILINNNIQPVSNKETHCSNNEYGLTEIDPIMTSVGNTRIDHS